MPSKLAIISFTLFSSYSGSSAVLMAKNVDIRQSSNMRDDAKIKAFIRDLFFSINRL